MTDVVRKRRWPWRWLAAIASGAGMSLLFPPFDLGGLVWVVLIPWLVAVWTLDGGKPGRRGFALGWLGGFAFFLTNLHWLTTVTSAGWVALAAFLALYPALWSAFAATWGNPWRKRVAREEGRIGRKVREKSDLVAGPARESWRQALASLRIGFAVAAVWCGQEWLRSWVFTGFGWNPLGVAFHETPVMAQAADLLGAVGLSFVPVFLQAVLVQTARRLWEESRAGRLRPHFDFGFAAVLVALVFCYGVWRLSTVGKGEAVPLRALMVQLNIPQDAARRLWSPEQIHQGYEDETLAALEAIEAEDAARLEQAEEGEPITLRRPDWIVWPESSLTGRLLTTGDGRWGTWQENLVTLGRIGERGDFTMILGLNEVEGESFGEELVMKDEAQVWNSLVVLPADGALKSFRKHHLVIFGEYIPWIEHLTFLQKIYEQQAGVAFGKSFSQGESFEPVRVELDGEAVGVLPSVCFEDTVPRLMRKFVRSGPQIIVNVTNDGWFKESPAAAQHFANSKFRAIELRRPMIRCSNTGVTAAVNAAGSTASAVAGGRQELRDEDGSHFTRGWLLAEVAIPKRPGTSLYAILGDWGVIGLALLGLGVGWLIGRSAATS